MNLRALSVLSLAFWSVLAAAQTPIYESKGKGGAVFSDQPASGAKRMDLPPPNVIQTPAPPQAAPKASVAPPPYRQLVIVSPESEGSVHTNTGAFQLKLQVQPALRSGAGDRFRVQLDGRSLATGYSSATIDITSADWARAAATETVEHRLKVAIVDRNGVTLAESAPLKFFVHRATR